MLVSHMRKHQSTGGKTTSSKYSVMDSVEKDWEFPGWLLRSGARINGWKTDLGLINKIF